MNDREAGGIDSGDPSSLEIETVKDFVSALLDLSFTSFVTPRVIQLVYLICLAFGGLWILFVIGSAFSVGIGLGLAMLVLSPLLYLVCVLFIRLSLEVVVVLFRIYETLSGRPL